MRESEQQQAAAQPQLPVPGSLFPGSPVNWCAWSDSAFERARNQNKPVLLSVGCSVCDWSLQMARESFADPETADYINANFICIGVDRDTRPDIGAVYQTLHLLLNGRAGGWPLTLFLCPHTRLPFIAGTYFPQESTESEILDFPTLLRKARDYFVDHAQDCKHLLAQIERNLRDLTGHLDAHAMPASNLIPEALRGLLAIADLREGGFGSEPKFTLPVNLDFLLQMACCNGMSGSLLQHLHHSLCRIAERGVHDRIGGGFFRYTLDAAWQNPSFDKMLSDNGLLLDVYARAHSLIPHPVYKQTVRGIARWLQERMLAPEGAFYSAEGAGSQGAFYCFTPVQLRRQLNDKEWRLCDALFDIQQAAQTGCYPGQVTSLESAAGQARLSEAEAVACLAALDEKLQLLRSSRSPPEIEETIVVSANALTIRGLAVAARFSPELLPLAESALQFIVGRMWIHQRLFSTWCHGRLGQHAFLEDYIYLIDALLELLQTRWRDRDYRLAMVLTESLLSLHEDTARGGFFQTAHDAEALLYRNKPCMDGIQPAGNGLAAKALLRLGHLSAEPRFVLAARCTLEAASLLLQHAPEHHLTLVAAHAEYLRPLPRVLIMDNIDNSAWADEVRQRYGTGVMCFRLPLDANCLPPDVMGLDPGEAIVCSGEECSPPCRTLEELVLQIDAQLSAAPARSPDHDSTAADCRENP